MPEKLPTILATITCISLSLRKTVLLYSVFVVHLGRPDVLSVVLPFMCMVYATHEGFYIYERERERNRERQRQRERGREEKGTEIDECESRE